MDSVTNSNIAPGDIITVSDSTYGINYLARVVSIPEGSHGEYVVDFGGNVCAYVRRSGSFYARNSASERTAHPLKIAELYRGADGRWTIFDGVVAGRCEVA